jgi:hypothetical protein
MKRRHPSFNIYFALACLVLAGGCAAFREVKQETNPKKEQSTIRLYLEGQHADRTTTGVVLVSRAKIPFTVERDSFLDEADLDKASIVEDADGTFYIQLQFNDHGTLLLDNYTTSNKGKHIIVFAQFPKPGKHPKAKKKDGPDDSDLVENDNPTTPPGTARESAWLAAVLIKDRIPNGQFRFTPDATRQESNRIVRGLRNIIPRQKKLEKF